MCYTSFQKYKSCRIFRQHYIYRDIQCEEMQMWSKLFKKEVWCRRIYEHGATAFADGERWAGPPNFPAPKAGMDVPQRLICHRCNAVRQPSQRFVGNGKKRPVPSSRMSVVVRRSLAVHANRTYELISRVCVQSASHLRQGKMVVGTKEKPRSADMGIRLALADLYAFQDKVWTF